MININNWDWPQWVTLLLYAISVIGATVKHGQPKGMHDAYMALAGAIVGALILAQGGFFK